MINCLRGRRKTDNLWRTLLVASFVFCCLLYFCYYFLVYKDIKCMPFSDCLTSTNPRTEKLQVEKCRNVCNTKECVSISNRILSNINPSTEPCNDFHQFVCGNYREKYEGSGNYSAWDAMTDNLYTALKDMIETSKCPDESATNKVKIVFESCMNPGSSDVRSVQDLLDFLNLIGIPHWPWLDENFTFASTPLYEMLGKLMSFEQYVFFDLHRIYGNLFPSDRLQNLKLSPAMISGVFEKITSEHGKNALITILLHLGLDTESSQNTTKSFISIEKERQELMLNASEVKCTEEQIVFNCSEEQHPNVNMLCSLMESIIRNGMVEPLFDRDRLKMSCDEYYYAKGLFNIIEKYKDRDIANYIAVAVFIHNIKDLDIALQMKLQSFLSIDLTEYDFSTSLDKKKKCIYWIIYHMHTPLGVMYIDKIFPSTAAEQLNDLVEKFINVTAELSLRQSWLVDSKLELAEGISSLDNFLQSYIEILQNIKEIDAMFEMFKPTRSSFIRNSLSLRKNCFTQILTDRMRNIRHCLPQGIFEVGAFGGHSTIRLSFGLLTPPVFNHRLPNLFNYAVLGFIIGHEIGHFFFNQFEYQIINVTKQTQDSYEEKTKCLIDQYSAFKLKKIEKNLQGSKTVSEDAADSLGMKAMEIVLKNYIENFINDSMVLPGLSYSSEQLSYIAMGQFWCDVNDAEKENYFYSVETHSPPKFRVIGTLQNSHRFSEVFGCSKTSYMNAEKKCITFE